jgi:hypothetical protein
MVGVDHADRSCLVMHFVLSKFEPSDSWTVTNIFRIPKARVAWFVMVIRFDIRSCCNHSVQHPINHDQHSYNMPVEWRDKGWRHPYSDRFYHICLDTSRYGASCTTGLLHSMLQYGVASSCSGPRHTCEGLGFRSLPKSRRRSTSLKIPIMFQRPSGHNGVSRSWLKKLHVIVSLPRQHLTFVSTCSVVGR